MPPYRLGPLITERSEVRAQMPKRNECARYERTNEVQAKRCRASEARANELARALAGVKRMRPLNIMNSEHPRAISNESCKAYLCRSPRLLPSPCLLLEKLTTHCSFSVVAYYIISVRVRPLRACA